MYRRDRYQIRHRLGNMSALAWLPHQNIGVLTLLSFLYRGLKAALAPPCRPYVIVPVVINLALFALGGWLLYAWLAAWVDRLLGWVPFIHGWCVTFISGLLISALLALGCYAFSTAATLLAAPFYGLLAERAERYFSGVPLPDGGWGDLIRDLPRICARELHKQCYYWLRALLCFIIFFIPVLDLAAPILWLMLNAWMGCLQYCDYTYDNHKVPFHLMLRDLHASALSTGTFGLIVSAALCVPLLNLLVPPAAVCAGTLYYLGMRRHLPPAEASE